MKIGLVGRGHWASVYANTLLGMGVPFWQAGRDWVTQPKPDAAIVACAPEAHYEVAKRLLIQGVPVLIEKPVCLTRNDAERLFSLAKFMGGIVYVGHTRLYSSEWKKVKKSLEDREIKTVHAQAGGASKLDWITDWGPHLIAMCLDLGFPPEQAVFHESVDRVPLKFIVNGDVEFAGLETKPSPLENLLTEFLATAQAGKTDLRGLQMGVHVMREIDRRKREQRMLSNGA